MERQDHFAEVSDQNKLRPAVIDQTRAEALGITSGWWAVDGIGTPVLGPYPTEAAVLIAIPEKRGLANKAG